MRNQDRFTERAQQALSKAQEAAQSMGHSYVGTEHFLLGIASEGEGLGVRKADPELRDKLSEAIKSALADGTVKELSMKWFKVDVSPQE